MIKYPHNPDFARFERRLSYRAETYAKQKNFAQHLSKVEPNNLGGPLYEGHSH